MKNEQTIKRQMSMNQDQFSHIIELLIMYKQMNPTNTVFLSENSVKEAIKWYQGLVGSMNINPEMIQSLASKMKQTE